MDPRTHLALYVVSDAALAGDHGVVRTAEAALEGGAGVIQLRDKDASTRELLRIAIELRRVTRAAGALFIVNDRLDVALAAEADGVHVGQDDMPAHLTRRLVGPRMIVGVSCHDVDEARRALADGADYLGVGALFPTPTKPDAGQATGLAVIGEIRAATGLPIVGIGGINARNAAEVIAAGADGIAVVSAVYGQPDPRAASAALLAQVREALRAAAPTKH
jgi:thiamine-phosphate pyrophosphorylase